MELVNLPHLEQEKSQGKAGQAASRLMSIDLAILDELEYLPISQIYGALLFDLISRLHQRTSVMIITNLSGGDQFAL